MSIEKYVSFKKLVITGITEDSVYTLGLPYRVKGKRIEIERGYVIIDGRPFENVGGIKVEDANS
jgi:hypothetical protein